jgi:hypothetical protein
MLVGMFLESEGGIFGLLFKFWVRYSSVKSSEF